jgi:hypothetical protein
MRRTLFRLALAAPILLALMAIPGPWTDPGGAANAAVEVADSFALEAHALAPAPALLQSGSAIANTYSFALHDAALQQPELLAPHPYLFGAPLDLLNEPDVATAVTGQTTTPRGPPARAVPAAKPAPPNRPLPELQSA